MSLDLWELIMLIAVLFVGGYFLEKGLRKWLNIGKSNKRFANKKHEWAVLITGAAALVVFLFMNGIFRTNNVNINPGNLILLIPVVMMSVEAFMQWKYHENPREYLITLIFLGIFIVFAVTFMAIFGIRYN
ncbi:DUF4181 domain-containing protein [Virgibacillus siamensis]|uniref:DUF4181 domain-containing protein n=1 Tax=Virgibacillus siamensis TaxID=480071 RepID=UPI000984399A|nr:DUF4181 domain-containing protein [Virgibacillus siamensis]